MEQDLSRHIHDIDYAEFIKAQDYADKFRILLNTENKLFAQVQGNSARSYQVTLKKSPMLLEVEGNCSCPAFDTYLQCKHIAAVIKYGDGEFFKNWDLEYYFSGTDEVHIDIPAEKMITQKLTFKDLHQNFLENNRLPTQNNPLNFYEEPPQRKGPHKIWYIVDYYENHNSMQIEFKLECQSLLKSGRLGKMKNVAITPDVIEHLPSIEDKKILGRLSAFARWEYSYSKDGSTFSVGTFHLSENLELFIDILKTNRAIYRTYDYYTGGVEEQLSFDENPATFALEIDSNKKKVTPSIHIADKAYPVESFSLFNSKEVIFKDYTFYRVENKKRIPQAVLDLIYECYSNEIELSDEDWRELQATILKYVPHNLLTGDCFNLKAVEIDVNFRLYLKWEEGTQYIRGLIHIPDDLTHSSSLVTLKYEKLETFLNSFKHFTYSEDTFVFEAKDLFDLCHYADNNKIPVYFKEKKVSSTTSFGLNVKSGIDWLELDPKIDVDFKSVDFESILKNLDVNSGVVNLKKDQVAIMPKKWLNKLLKLQRHGRINKNQILLHPAKALLLDDFPEAKLPKSIIELKKELHNFIKVKHLKESTHFNGELRTYQRLALGWFDFLERCHFGGCLADDMGLGKTIQVIAHFQKKIIKNKNFKALIVCPKSLTSNWVDEFHKFAPNITIRNWQTGTLKKVESNITVVSYQLLQRQGVDEHSFDYLILDEAQMVKNPHSLTHKAVMKIKAKNKLALTGTPVENHAGDIMSIFNIIIPSLFEAKKIKNPHKLDNFNFLRPFILRRTKDEVLTELPEKNIQTLYCEQLPAEKKKYFHYHKALKLALEQDSDITKNKFNLLQILTKLRQAACHIKLIEDSNISSSKMETLKELVNEIHDSDQKVIIFSQFTRLLKIVQNELDLDDMNSSYLDGQTRNRDKVIQSFKEDQKKKTFLISIKAGGVGLNLTNASYCIILDPWWNPAVESQAIDRIHRIGQKNTVFAYRLITKGTIEEKVSKLQEEKVKLYHKILENNEGFIKELNKNDIDFLLS